jgi:transposase
MGAATPGEARVVEPVLDHAAVENARLVNAARAQLLRSGTAVTVEAIAEACGKEAATVRRWVARQRRSGPWSPSATTGRR